MLSDPEKGALATGRKKRPEYGLYERYTAAAEPVRYVRQGSGYRKIEETGRTAKIMCAGDLMCEPAMSRAVCFNGKFLFEMCFSQVKDVFLTSDFAIANLETMVDSNAPYAVDKHRIDGRYHCNAPVEYLEALRYAGFDALAMANNHSADTGPEGLVDTVQHVDRLGFMHTGAFADENEKRYILAEINGIKVAVLSYTEHINSNIDKAFFTEDSRNIMINRYSPDKLKKDLAEARKDGAEFSICYIHFLCKEYSNHLTERQKAVAHEIAETGVDCIMGSHAHAIQPYDTIETSDGRMVPIVYGLGNFITSDNTSMITRRSIIFCLELGREENGRVSILKEGCIPCRTIEGIRKSSFIVFPTSAEWRDGNENTILSDAEKDIVSETGGKLPVFTKQWLAKERNA